MPPGEAVVVAGGVMAVAVLPVKTVPEDTVACVAVTGAGAGAGAGEVEAEEGPGAVDPGT